MSFASHDFFSIPFRPSLIEICKHPRVTLSLQPERNLNQRANPFRIANLLTEAGQEISGVSKKKRKRFLLLR